MKKLILLLAVLMVLSACICKPIVSGLAEGRTVKLYIADKMFKGELLSVTPEMIIIRFYDKQKKKDVILGTPLPETKLCKVHKSCGPIGDLFVKDRKFYFKDKPVDKINENIADLSHDAMYASKVPDWVKEQLTPYNQL